MKNPYSLKSYNTHYDDRIIELEEGLERVKSERRKSLLKVAGFTVLPLGVIGAEVLLGNLFGELTGLVNSPNYQLVYPIMGGITGSSLGRAYSDKYRDLVWAVRRTSGEVKTFQNNLRVASNPSSSVYDYLQATEDPEIVSSVVEDMKSSGIWY